MKIAVSSSGKDFNAQLDPRFGRCRYFLIIETDTMECEVFDNENAALGGGAGIQSAQLIATKGAKALITGHCGPNAMQTLSAAGVQVYVGQAGSVKDIMETYQNGKLTPTTEASVAAHAGMGGMDGGQDRGMGRGRGMGGGRGGGMGGGGRVGR
jgi:predicted Fe-Mo cluster-binding NifX family protein